MSIYLYEKLIQEVCDLHKLDVAHVLAEGAVDMDGVQFFFAYDRDANSPLLTVYCGFGVVPKHLHAQAYAKLLEANLSTYTGQGETFCLAPDGHVIMANNYVLEALTPELLTGFMAITTALAKDWQKNYFLDKEKPAGSKFSSKHLLNKVVPTPGT